VEEDRHLTARADAAHDVEAVLLESRHGGEEAGGLGAVEPLEPALARISEQLAVGAAALGVRGVLLGQRRVAVPLGTRGHTRRIFGDRAKRCQSWAPLMIGP
jgi:hypothetical protein